MSDDTTFYTGLNQAAQHAMALKPFAVPMGLARKLLGEKARSEIYEKIGEGLLVAVKDGTKTLITVESIEKYMAALPPAKIKATLRRQHQKP